MNIWIQNSIPLQLNFCFFFYTTRSLLKFVYACDRYLCFWWGAYTLRWTTLTVNPNFIGPLLSCPTSELGMLRLLDKQSLLLNLTEIRQMTGYEGFTAVFRTARFWTLSWASLIITSHLIFEDQFKYYPSICLHFSSHNVWYTFRSCHPSWFRHTNVL